MIYNPTNLSTEGEYALYNADCTDILASLPNDTFQTIFADPPYFLSKGGFRTKNGNWVDNSKGEWDKSISQEEMDQFNFKWINLCYSKLKNDGTIWICGTFHNIFSVERTIKKCGFKIINIITWQKTDPQPSLTGGHFKYSTELIIWAKKKVCKAHFFNETEVLKSNYGKELTDVWTMASVNSWEKAFGKHPTQKPLRLLHRVILASTQKGDYILDPFMGSGTTGVMAKLLERKFIGIEKELDYYKLSLSRIQDVESEDKRTIILEKILDDTEISTVIVNNVRKDVYANAIDKGLCYFRLGDTNGSILVIPGFEKIGYVMLCCNGYSPKLFKLKNRGFKVWSCDDLKKYGFTPNHANYYAVLFFDKTKPIPCKLSNYIKEKLKEGQKELFPVNLVMK